MFFTSDALSAESAAFFEQMSMTWVAKPFDREVLRSAVASAVDAARRGV